MAIGVKGQFFLRFKVGSNDDFLSKDDLIAFTVFENSGNQLPTFEWIFKSRDESVLKSLNEGNIVQAQYGKDRDNLLDVELSISSVSPTKDNADFVQIACNGYASRINYITEHSLSVTPEQSAVEASLAKAQESGFNVVSNIQNSSDSQKWIQHNISNKAFVNDCYMRADLGDSSCAVAITADGKFILKDLQKEFDDVSNGNNYAFKFTKNPEKENDIPYDSDSEFESQSGFINNWIGYGREIKLINNESGEVSNIFEEPQVTLALSNVLDKLANIGPRYGGVKFQSESVHEKFNESYNHNLIYLANLSKISNIVSVTDAFFSIKPLDVVMFVEEGTKGVKQSSDLKSGLYIASGVVRSFQSERVNTLVTLNREVLNETKVGENVS